MSRKAVLSFIGLVALQMNAQKDQHSMQGKNGEQAKSEEHHEGVNERGAVDAGMGLSQTATTRHFILTANGGVIQVTANDAADKQSIEQVKMHFQHIGQAFANGDFAVPHFVHETSVPGVKTMKRPKKQISYIPENLDNGARLKIETKSPEALRAIHEFLRFQIADHRTGDSGKVETSSK